MGGGDCMIAEAAAQPNRGGGRGQVGRYYILLLIIYYRSLLSAAHFWLVGSYYI